MPDEKLTPTMLRNAAKFSLIEAYRAIADAHGNCDAAVSKLLSLAARKIRDADTFNGKANMLEMTGRQE